MYYCWRTDMLHVEKPCYMSASFYCMLTWTTYMSSWLYHALTFITRMYRKTCIYLAFWHISHIDMNKLHVNIFILQNDSFVSYYMYYIYDAWWHDKLHLACLIPDTAFSKFLLLPSGIIHSNFSTNIGNMIILHFEIHNNNNNNKCTLSWIYCMRKTYFRTYDLVFEFL